MSIFDHWLSEGRRTRADMDGDGIPHEGRRTLANARVLGSGGKSGSVLPGTAVKLNRDEALFHGTGDLEGLTARGFQVSMTGAMTGAITWVPGAYATPDPSYASAYGKVTQVERDRDLKLLQIGSFNDLKALGDGDAVARTLTAQGFDGVRWKGLVADELVIFDPSGVRFTPVKP